MQKIGRITLLQVQRSTLKLGERLKTFYDPTPLLAVERLRLTAQGVWGMLADGSEVMDLHHIDHPETHNIDGVNGVSIGFTSHYQSMREAYGEHLVNGIGGENILIEADRIMTLNDLGSRIAIALQQTGQIVYLTELEVAAPCIEFSQFVANHDKPLPPDKLKATLQFLNDGRRGFYASMEDATNELIVHVGDTVFVD